MSPRSRSRPPHDPNCACTVMSRRALLGATALGAGALALSKAGAVSALEARVDELNAPGSALRPAERISPPDGDTVGPLPFEPPEPGEILFPIVVRERDYCAVLDNFGDTRGRPAPYYHMACDIMADEGLPLRAVVDGVLTRRHDDRFFGWTLYDEVTDVTYRYFHNTPDANGFVEGDRVRQGDIIGFVGDTGTTPGNFHLHFEYRPGNVPADCYHLLQRAEHVLFW